MPGEVRVCSDEVVFKTNKKTTKQKTTQRKTRPKWRVLVFRTSWPMAHIPPQMNMTPRMGRSNPQKTDNETPLHMGGVAVPCQLPKADLLTFWFSRFGPFLVMVPKG